MHTTSEEQQFLDALDRSPCDVAYRLGDNPAIDKCIFIVVRKDLDRQTRSQVHFSNN